MQHAIYVARRYVGRINDHPVLVVALAAAYTAGMITATVLLGIIAAPPN